ncbi:MAG: PrsW family glutamic-type intramembrane protease [Candidatus Paceibacterota bacterium]
MFNNPKILGLAFLGGIIPSLLWLWFWLKEDKKSPEPAGLLSIIFALGAISVFFVLPVQRFIQAHVAGDNWELIAMAAAEELIKYIAVAVVIYQNYYANDPIDWPIYLITAALGFAALENTLYLIKPLTLGETTVGLLTGHLRYLGSTLLHTVASGVVGISIGFALHMSNLGKTLHLFFGLTLAVALHSAFNFFIIRNDGSDFLKVFAFLWVATIIVMLVFEKLRRLN